MRSDIQNKLIGMGFEYTGDCNCSPGGAMKYYKKIGINECLIKISRKVDWFKIQYKGITTGRFIQFDEQLQHHGIS